MGHGEYLGEQKKFSTDVLLFVLVTHSPQEMIGFNFKQANNKIEQLHTNSRKAMGVYLVYTVCMFHIQNYEFSGWQTWMISETHGSFKYIDS